jgi:hypothetical protein
MLALVKNASRYTLIETCCVAGLYRVVMMSYFLGNDAASVNAFYFVGYSQPELVFSLLALMAFFVLECRKKAKPKPKPNPEADVYIAVTVLTDVKPCKI